MGRNGEKVENSGSFWKRLIFSLAGFSVPASISTRNSGHSENALDNCTKMQPLFVVYPHTQTLIAQEFYTEIIVSEMLKESSYIFEGQLEIQGWSEDICVPKLTKICGFKAIKVNYSW